MYVQLANLQHKEQTFWKGAGKKKIEIAWFETIQLIAQEIVQDCIILWPTLTHRKFALKLYDYQKGPTVLAKTVGPKIILGYALLAHLSTCFLHANLLPYVHTGALCCIVKHPWRSVR